jgi:pyruvate dehydrogenase E2 component (dihydrolipoamide acetyltransferase)
MPTEVIMPKVDMDMETGTLSVWHVAEGAAVTKGAPLFDIETDKAAMEVESPATGWLRGILATPGQSVPVGAPVAWIYAEGEAVAAPSPSPAPSVPAPEAKAPETEPARTADPRPEAASAAPRAEAGAAGARATPIARRLARDAGLTLASVTGTGPRGRVQRADVEQLLAARAKAPNGFAPAPTPEPAPAPVTAFERAPDPAPERAGGQVQTTPDLLHVTRRGGTGTPLLLLHGFAADSFGWAPLERELPADLPLIRLDLPNHGRSPRQSIADFAGLVASVTRTFDTLGEEPVHVLAHSLGGAVALALADLRPRRIASLTLIAPAGLGAEIDGAALAGIARARQVESLAPWLKRLTARPDGISWDFAKAAMLARVDPEFRAAQAEMAESLFPDGVQSFDLAAALARVAAPAAILWGREDHILPWKQALTAPGHIALHLLRGIGHIPHMESPDVTAGIVMRNLGKPRPA